MPKKQKAAKRRDPKTKLKPKSAVFQAVGVIGLNPILPKKKKKMLEPVQKGKPRSTKHRTKLGDPVTEKAVKQDIERYVGPIWR